MKLLLLLVAAQGPIRTGPEQVVAFRTEQPIAVDGRLTESTWDSAPGVGLPFEIRPRENAPAAVPTSCRVAFDERALYVGCEATDRTEDLRAYYTDRDGIGDHDRITLFIDPFADGRRGFFFGVNPLGVQQDGIFDGPSGVADLAWDAIWESAGRVTEAGYVVEMAIPFRSIRFPSGADVEPWRFFVERDWPRSEHLIFRTTRLDQSDACNLCQSDQLLGLGATRPGRGVRLSPTLTTSRTDRRDAFPAGPMEIGEVDPAVGMTAQLRLTERLALNATVNPDFSQVEADVAQLDVNEQFSLFFPEKRPFFLEGTEVFQTPLRAAFTRNVADPTAGLSLTGKVGRTLVASMAARDERTSILVPGNQGSSTIDLGRPSASLFQRVRTDVGPTGTAGLLYTGRFADGYRSQLLAVDGFYRLTPLIRINAQMLRSYTTDAAPVTAVTGGNGSSRGHAAFLRLQRASFSMRRTWFGAITYSERSPDFRADAGFEPQVDQRRVDADVSLNAWSNGAKWFTRLNYWIGGHHSETFDGRLNSQEAWWWVYYAGPGQTSLWVWPRWGRQFFQGQTFRVNYWEMSLSSRPWDDVKFSVNVKLGDEIDFANARGGTVTRVSPSAAVRVGRHVDVELQHRVQRLTHQGRHVFTAHLSQARFVYNFSARAFVRGIAQYRHTSRSTANYVTAVDRVSTGLFTQWLLSYRINAQTGLFVGYADNRAGVEPETDPRVPLTQTDRTFFLKLGYAWSP